MTTAPFRCTLIALILAATGPALAESLATSASSAASSASSAGSASLGSSSDSIKGSSDSSRDGNQQVAEGEYRVAALAPVDGRSDMLRLKLEPHRIAGAAAGFTLDLPQRALADRPLAPGDIVSARHRPYGLEFARGETRDAFFLVLADDWHRDLQTRVVTN